MVVYNQYNLMFADAKNKTRNDQPTYNKNHMATNHCKNLTSLEHKAVVCKEMNPMDEL